MRFKPRKVERFEQTCLLPLNNGEKCLLDLRFADWVEQWFWTFCARKWGTVVLRQTGRGPGSVVYRLHRELVEQDGQIIPDKWEVDHINGNTLDCRLENLRVCEHGKNVYNKGNYRNRKHSEYKGVYVEPGRKGARAWLQVDKKQVYLGTFDTPELASAAYEQAALEHFGAFKRAKENY